MVLCTRNLGENPKKTYLTHSYNFCPCKFVSFFWCVCVHVCSHICKWTCVYLNMHLCAYSYEGQKTDAGVVL